jgi:hypothetical protein
MLSADRKAQFFKGVTISPAEWHAVELVNKVLKVGFVLFLSSHLS